MFSLLTFGLSVVDVIYLLCQIKGGELGLNQVLVQVTVLRIGNFPWFQRAVNVGGSLVL